MIFKITEAQEECLKGAEGQPVGRKGEKWLTWANSVLEEEGLPPVEVEKDEPESHTKSTSKQQSKGKPAQTQHPAQQQQGEIHITRTFVVQSGVLKGPGVSVRFNEGLLTGYFKVTRETRSKASHDDLRIELPAGMMLDGPSEAAAAAGGVQEKKAGLPLKAAAAAAGGGEKQAGLPLKAAAAAAGGGEKKAGLPLKAAAAAARGGGGQKVSDSDKDSDDDSKDSDNDNKDSEKDSDDSEEVADKTDAQMTPTRGGKRKETGGQATDNNKKGRLGMRM